MAENKNKPSLLCTGIGIIGLVSDNIIRAKKKQW